MPKHYSTTIRIISLITLTAFIITQPGMGYALRTEQASGNAVGAEIANALGGQAAAPPADVSAGKATGGDMNDGHKEGPDFVTEGRRASAIQQAEKLARARAEVRKHRARRLRRAIIRVGLAATIAAIGVREYIGGRDISPLQKPPAKIEQRLPPMPVIIGTPLKLKIEGGAADYFVKDAKGRPDVQMFEYASSGIPARIDALLIKGRLKPDVTADNLARCWMFFELPRSAKIGSKFIIQALEDSRNIHSLEINDIQVIKDDNAQKDGGIELTLNISPSQVDENKVSVPFSFSPIDIKEPVVIILRGYKLFDSEKPEAIPIPPSPNINAVPEGRFAGFAQPSMRDIEYAGAAGGEAAILPQATKTPASATSSITIGKYTIRSLQDGGLYIVIRADEGLTEKLISVAQIKEEAKGRPLVIIDDEPRRGLKIAGVFGDYFAEVALVTNVPDAQSEIDRLASEYNKAPIVIDNITDENAVIKPDFGTDELAIIDMKDSLGLEEEEIRFRINARLAIFV